jgi:GNAT superfamily N-acetyltransferase
MQDVLPEGGVIRKLWIGETAKYRDHMLRLDPASRRSRFGGGVSDDFIRGYVNLSVSLDAVVHGFFVGGVMRGGAELRPLGARFPRQAEAAISVEKPWQSHGVGSALIRCTLLAARNRNFRLLHMACLAENHRMQQLARKFDAELSFDFGGVIGEVESSRATPLSLMREFMADGHGFATAMLDLQSRMLRVDGAPLPENNTSAPVRRSRLHRGERIRNLDDIGSATDRRTRGEQHETRHLERQ